MYNRDKDANRWDGRKDYDLTDVYADIYGDCEPDYIAIMAELAGCSMTAYSGGYNDIDSNGCDIGDGFEVDNDSYND